MVDVEEKKMHMGVGRGMADPEGGIRDRSFMEGEDNIVDGLREPLLLKRRLSNTSSQIAVIGANTCPIESLDYETIENDVLNQDWRSRNRIQIFQYVFCKWTLALLIGLATGVVGFLNNLAVENIAGFKLLLVSNLMLSDRYYQAFLALAGCNLVLGTSAAAICAYIAPAAAGSGIPEVKAYLNGVDAHSILAPTTLFVKIFGSIGGVSAGFMLGKEGPMVHTGACIANLLGQGGSRKYHLTWRWLRFFKNDRDRRDLITCGAAAGVAAAFRAPVGGVLFALEEAASWWRSALLWRTFFTTAMVAVVLRALIGYCRSGYCGLFGEGGLIMFDVSKMVTTYSTPDLIVVLVLGVIGGLLGALYNFLLDRILRVYSVINEKGAPSKILMTATISFLTTCLAFSLPWMVRCKPCPANIAEECPTIGRSGNFKSFQCPEGHYNDLASLLLNTNEDAIRNLFSGGTESDFQLSTLFIFFIAVYCLGLLTYGIAVPSGLFIPVILAGASCGRIVGTLMGSIGDLHPGLFALLGSAAFLGGTMRMTVSVCVILLELTNDLIMLPLVMLLLLISKTIADCFNKGVYDQIVTMKGLPYMESHPEPYMRNLVTGDIISGPLVTFSGIEKVGTILHGLKLTGHNGFPVIDEADPFTDSSDFVGLVLRSHLLMVLKCKNFRRDNTVPTMASSENLLREYVASDFEKAGSGKGLKIEDLNINDDEMEMYVDLHPVTNKTPYTVMETMSVAKAAMLLRELGLRHMCVVPKTPGKPPVIGILTRHDFMPEHICGRFPNIENLHN